MAKAKPSAPVKTFSTPGSFPQPLNSTEEAHFLAQYQSGTPSEKETAKNTLIERNLRLVAHIVKKFNHPDTEDLISIGTIGLIKGIYSFKPEKGTRLATYVSRCIENEIRMHLRAIKKFSGDVSLQDSVSFDKDGSAQTLEDKIADDAEPLADAVVLKLEAQRLYANMHVLDEREKEIIMLRYGLLDGHEVTQREIGQKMDISRSYVSRIEKKALSKLREKMEKH